jgi:hypothetical protein
MLTCDAEGKDIHGSTLAIRRPAPKRLSSMPNWATGQCCSFRRYPDRYIVEKDAARKAWPRARRFEVAGCYRVQSRDDKY